MGFDVGPGYEELFVAICMLMLLQVATHVGLSDHHFTAVKSGGVWAVFELVCSLLRLLYLSTSASCSLPPYGHVFAIVPDFPLLAWLVAEQNARAVRQNRLFYVLLLALGSRVIVRVSEPSNWVDCILLQTLRCFGF